MEQLRVGDESYGFHKLDAAATRLPYTLRIRPENVVRTGGGAEPVAGWVAGAEPSQEISFHPARVLLQDFTGVPAVVDLAAMRDAMRDQGGDPKAINPQIPAELVIDHSVQVDEFASRLAIERNVELEFERNRERYAFLRWGQGAFDSFRVVPPNTGIVHQINLEYLARVVEVRDGVAFPDTLVGTDSHTTMVNGIGVLGWGVGGIEAEAAMLGQPIAMLIPDVIGFRLTGKMPEGSTATDLVLTVTQMLRKKGVVGKFVEFFGPGLGAMPLADRATIANMAPEYGAPCGIFPIDEETLIYLRLTGRSEAHITRVEAYAKERGLDTKPWVKTSLAPGSKAVTDYLVKAGLMRSLEQLRFFLVGYGCTTCIGNSGPLPAEISKTIAEHELVVSSVLSGNRNFEGRVHPEVRANYLASPPLVVAYALAGRVDIDWDSEPVGIDPAGQPVFLKDIWPTQAEVQAVVEKSVKESSFRRIYSEVF